MGIMVEWITSDGLTPYEDALAEMERRAEAIRAGTEDEAILAGRASAAFTPPAHRPGART